MRRCGRATCTSRVPHSSVCVLARWRAARRGRHGAAQRQQRRQRKQQQRSWRRTLWPQLHQQKQQQQQQHLLLLQARRPSTVTPSGVLSCIINTNPADQGGTHPQLIFNFDATTFTFDLHGVQNKNEVVQVAPQLSKTPRTRPQPHRCRAKLRVAAATCRSRSAGRRSSTPQAICCRPAPPGVGGSRAEGGG